MTDDIATQHSYLLTYIDDAGTAQAETIAENGAMNERKEVLKDNVTLRVSMVMTDGTNVPLSFSKQRDEHFSTQRDEQ